MFIAKDEKGNHIPAKESIKGRKYFCPCCGEELVLRQGDIKVWHYAHKSGKDCDILPKTMTKWHYNWQEMFPTETREVVFRNDVGWHRADVCVGNTVLEFQHSKISPENMNKRTEFYQAMGKELIWVFDRTDTTPQLLTEQGTGLNVNPTWTGVYNIYDPVFKYLYNDYIDFVALDYGKYVLVTYDFDYYGEKVVNCGSLVLSRELFVEIVSRDGWEEVLKAYEKTQDFWDAPLARKVRNFLESYCNSAIKANHAEDSKNSGSVENLFMLLGKYVVAEECFKGLKFKHSRWRRLSFSYYLANAEGYSYKGDAESACKFLQYGSPFAYFVSFEDICNEIRKWNYLEPDRY